MSKDEECSMVLPPIAKSRLPMETALRSNKQRGKDVSETKMIKKGFDLVIKK